MKIKSFAVNNFRGISGGLEQNKIEFGSSNTLFIFGQNNVGKSTFLRAYEFFYLSSKPTIEDYFEQNQENIIEFQIELYISDKDLEKGSIKAKANNLKQNWLNDEGVLRIKKIYGTKEDKKTGKIDFTKPENQTFDFKQNTWIDKSYGGVGLDSVFQDALPTPIFIKAMPTEQEVENIVNEVLASKATKNLKAKDLEELRKAQETIASLQDKVYNPESIAKYKDEVNQHFRNIFPDTSIEILEKDKVKWTESALGRKFNIEFQRKDDSGSVNEDIPTNFEKIGHGAVRTAIFSLMLMRDIVEEYERSEDEKDYIVLFEEPELFLHPKILKELRELIYSVSVEDSPYQILCASHSPQMIDCQHPFFSRPVSTKFNLN